MIEAATGLSQAYQKTHTWIRELLDDSEIDLSWRPDPTWNTAGVLIKHILYAERSALIRAEGGDPPKVSHEENFSPAGTDRASLLSLLAQVEERAKTTFERATLSAWRQEDAQFFGRTISREEAAFHGLLHANRHLGQIYLMKRVHKVLAASQ